MYFTQLSISPYLGRSTIVGFLIPENSLESLVSTLEKEMTIHSSIPAWRIPGIEEPVRLQSTGMQRVGHD